MNRFNNSVVLAGVLVLVLVCVFGLSFEKRRHTGIMQSQLQGKAEELDRQLSQFAVVPRLLSRNPIIVNALRSPGSTTLQAANESLLRARLDSNAAFAFLMDIDGSTIASSNYADEVSFVGVNYGFRPYFLQALDQNEATFFAIGATTGVPGYFVANPIVDADAVIGVVVVKFDLDRLLTSWNLPPYHWLAVDEFGVVILSTNHDFLYAKTREIESGDLEKISSDRRYLLSELSFQTNKATGRLVEEASGYSFFMQQVPSTVENWTLQLIVELSYLFKRVAVYLLSTFALLTLAALVYRNMQAQKSLAATEKRHARQLEAEVRLRTEELRSAQQSLISESNYAMLGRMSGAINHEINQPLASLRLNLASLRQQIEKPEVDMSEIQQIVVDSDRTTKRIGRVITTLRNLTSQKRVEHGDVKIDRIVSEVSETIKRERPAMYNSLSVSVEDNLPKIKGSEVLLQQAILNLLYNAFDAVLEVEDPSVSLSAVMIKKELAIEVADNGYGVSDIVEKDLFKPFVSDKTRKSGLGLGLTLVEMIAKDHSGSLQYRPADAKSDKVSVFIFTIPVLKEARDD